MPDEQSSRAEEWRVRRAEQQAATAREFDKLARPQPPCPNPHGMTEEFPEDIIEARAWRIKGVGIYGTDIDVIAIDEYRELAHQQKATLETLIRWANSAKENEERAEKAEERLRTVEAAAREVLMRVPKPVGGGVGTRDDFCQACGNLGAVLYPENSEEG